MAGALCDICAILDFAHAIKRRVDNCSHRRKIQVTAEELIDALSDRRRIGEQFAVSNFQNLKRRGAGRMRAANHINSAASARSAVKTASYIPSPPRAPRSMPPVSFDISPLASSLPCLMAC